MSPRGINRLIVIVLSIILSMSPFAMAVAEEERDEGYYTVYEENTREVIFVTARVLNVGDRYLNHENRLYEVVEISGDDAVARFVEEVDLQKVFEAARETMSAETTLGEDAASVRQKKEKVVAIYCTHSDESYIPSDGAASIPHNGGVYKVGAALKKAFEERGIKAIQSFTSHNPHDAMAYQRSRRTAMELLKQQPDAVIDVHRDAVPAEHYQGNVKGQPLAQVQLVVGRQNPQMEASDNFAKQIKANADKHYPGLVKGIFYGKGGYNQDLYPRTILIEAGTYLNSREKAQEGANFLADVIATTLYGEDYNKTSGIGGGGAGGTTQVPKERGSVGRAVLWIAGLSILGLGGYILVSTGGIKEFSAKTRQFIGTEFTNFLGNLNKKSETPSQDDEDRDNSSEEE